jgi:DAPG hydrolase PhiG domain
MSETIYLGYKGQDFAKPFSKYLNENVKGLKKDMLVIREKGCLAASSILPLKKVNLLSHDGYHSFENGFCKEEDGSYSVAVHTIMPEVRAVMWHWWFGWHGCDDSRYKLWHPKAHLAVQWADGSASESYINRTSIIKEFIGKNLESAAIQFVEPSTLGIQDNRSVEDVVYICARLGLAKLPIDFGYLIHQVRNTADGAEMRSRFYIGGNHIGLRGRFSFLKPLTYLIMKFYKVKDQQARDLFTHCSEEMHHLADFLPKLYKEFK